MQIFKKKGKNMKKRSPIAVFLFGFLTLGLYSWYWSVKTKGEMNKMGEKIPTAFLWLIPIVGPIWWFWKYSEGVEHVTNKELSGVLAFIVLWLLGPIGNAIVQDYFNKIGTVTNQAPAAVTPGPQMGAASPMQPPTSTVPPAPAQVPQSEAPQGPPTATPPKPPACRWVIKRLLVFPCSFSNELQQRHLLFV